MARATALPRAEAGGAEPGRALLPGGLSGRNWSLTARILVFNVIALGLLAASLFYIDNYRRQLLGERFQRARSETEIAAVVLSEVAPQERLALLGAIGASQHLRLRVYNRAGRLVADSFSVTPGTVTFTDPAREPLLTRFARGLDRAVDVLVGAPSVPPYAEPAIDRAQAWPEIVAARHSGHTEIRQRYARDRTPVITAASRLGSHGAMLLSLRHAPDVTQNVRDARQTLGLAVGAALLLSVLLSLFLARTIVQPLRLLVRAAVRVRLGRDRAVVVPRLPERGDEIGLLARAVSDMTAALRQRIDAVESFAADVAHELKNPLASLRSALESLEKVEDAGLRRQLGAIAAHDVTRIDRLVTEIADASRIDAQLSRVQFEPVDVAALAEALVGARMRRPGARATIHMQGPGGAAALVAGDAARLERVFDNLLDNAESFSPSGGVIRLIVAVEAGRVIAEVIDEGPGIPEEARERVFERFHSLRPAGEDFGDHSGLGLAIARTIVEAHGGRLTAQDRGDGASGARLRVELPARTHEEAVT
ncbi:MAG: sensor N-terminal transmembrane domain-containing protein [Sphingomonadales bacterium]|nr:sensor N-terminal transmembrane domain-containing protein [Sphingomonadales bacterium]